MGIPKEYLSGFESFEAPDPAEWVPYGYAIANVNARGILGSDGDHRYVKIFCVVKTMFLQCTDGMEHRKDRMGMMLSNLSHPFPGRMEKSH